MRKITILFGLLLLITAFASASATWTEQWHFDVASFDYNQFIGHYNHWGRIHYRSETMPVCANTIDNGVGSAGDPILEVYIAGGMGHDEEGGNTSLYVSGGIYCINGATGAVIWYRQDPDCVFVHTIMELADINDDGHLELYVTDYHGSMMLNAQTGDIIWKITDYVHRLDKHTVMIRGPSDNIVYIYTGTMGGPLYKRVATTGEIVDQTFSTGGPCFGGCSAVDFNGDGIPEIIEGSGYPGIYCFDLDLNLIWSENTVTTTGACLIPINVNNDGWPDVVVVTASSSNARIGVIDGLLTWNNRIGVGTGTAVWMAGKSMTHMGASCHNAPAVYDIDGDGNLEAGVSWYTSGASYGAIWDLGTWQKEPWIPNIENGYSTVFANVWGDSSHLEIMNGPYNKVWDYTGAQVFSNTKHGSAPMLVADVDGDSINEALSDGSNIFNVPGSPWGGDVWSWGWNICWETGATALNTRQEVLSQLYNTRRTGSELPAFEYWWEESPSPPQQSITVVSPNGGETWQVGNTYAVTWTSNNISGNVNIELYKGSVPVYAIETNTPNDGYASWTISSSTTPDTDYKIKITSVDGTVSDFSDSYFTIVAPPQQSITVVSPNGGETWQVGNTYAVTWTSNNISGNVNIELYKGSVPVYAIETNTPNDGYASWTISSSTTPDTDYKIKITSVDGTVSDFSDSYFTIVAPPEPLTIDGPSWGLINRNYTFCINVTNPDGNNLYCKWDWGEGNITDWLGPYASGETICASYAWSQKGIYGIQVKVKDAYGLESNWSNPHVITIYELKKTIIFGRYTNATPEDGFITIEAASLRTIQFRPFKYEQHIPPAKIMFSSDYIGIKTKRFIFGVFDVAE
ncbi:MAG: VCBS repeat-containing protein [Actinobacteria bacterium]|nr:VCBS repeat-containing protein [Actinomycetota bacterium]